MTIKAILQCSPRELQDLHEALLDRYTRVANKSGQDSSELERVKQLLDKVAAAQVTCDRVAQLAA